jgi:ATP-binding cassette subfamily F protein 3
LQLGYFGQTNIQRLDPKLTIEQEIQNANGALTRTQVRNICGTMMFSGDMALKKVTVLSGGEKSRTLLGKILAHPSNLLLLDEPNNHLDMESIDALIESLQNFPGALLIVTHNEGILRALATKLIVFHRGKVDVFEAAMTSSSKRSAGRTRPKATARATAHRRSRRHDPIATRKKNRPRPSAEKKRASKSSKRILSKTKTR